MRDIQMQQNQQDGFSFKQVIKPMAVSFIISVIATLLLLFLFSFIIAGKDVPKSAVWMITIGISAIGSFLFGFLAARKIGRRGLIVGAVCGLIICLLFLCSGSLLFEAPFSAQTGCKFAVILVAAVIGGLLGVNSKQKSRV